MVSWGSHRKEEGNQEDRVFLLHMGCSRYVRQLRSKDTSKAVPAQLGLRVRKV